MGALGLNLPPFFTKDMNQHTLVENTPVGSAIYTLEGEDPEGSEVIFDLDGTDMFRQVSRPSLTGATLTNTSTGIG